MRLHELPLLPAVLLAGLACAPVEESREPMPRAAEADLGERIGTTAEQARELCDDGLVEAVADLLEHRDPDWEAPTYLNEDRWPWEPWGRGDVRQRWNHQNQGTRILPLSWLLAFRSLNEPGTSYAERSPFLADPHIRSYGYLPDHDTRCNPFELPVGMALDGTFSVPAVEAPLEEEPVYFGYTCAACHTTEMRIGDAERPVRILGGAGLPNQSRFNMALGQAVAEAVATPESRRAFVGKVLALQAQLYAGRTQTPETLAKALRQLAERARPGTDVGAGRLDALNNGGNFIFSRYLARFHGGLPGALEDAARNTAPLDAPVGMPPIYDVPKFDWAYYGHSFRDPFIRALSETVAVSAPTALEAPEADGAPWNTSAKAEALLWLEEKLRRLDAPRFPEPGSGPHPEVEYTYEELRREGERLFWEEPDVACARCHSQRGTRLGRPSSGWRPGTEYRLGAVPVGVIGTDPNNVAQFATRQIALPDEVVADLAPFSPYGPTDDPKYRSALDRPGEPGVMYAPDVLEALLVGVGGNLFEQLGWGAYPTGPYADEGRRSTLGRQVCDGPASFRGECRRIRPWVSDFPAAHDSVLFEPDTGHDPGDPRCGSLDAEACRALRERTGWLVYRARPLRGMWATAPFLHNNSVENMCALLGSAALGAEDSRFSRGPFRVGATDFDPICLGFESSETMPDGSTPASRFSHDPASGDSNRGHYFSDRYDGTIRPGIGIIGRKLEKWEIFALIEYLKSDRFNATLW